MKRLLQGWRWQILRTILLIALLGLIGGLAWWLGTELYAENRFAAAESALQRYDFAAADSALQSCLDVRPERFRFHFLAAQTARRAENFQKAEEHLGWCQRVAGKKNDVSRLEWALLHAQQGELADVEGALWALADQAHSDRLLILEAMARGYIQSYRLTLAEKCLRQLLEAAPQHREAWIWRAGVFELLGNQAEAIRFYKRALELAPENDDCRLRLASYLVQVNLATEAREHFEELRRRQPANPDVLVGLASCHAAAGHLEEATKLLHEALKLQPKHAQGLAEMGRLTLLAGHAARAEVWARKSLAVEPSDRAANYLFCQCLERTGQKEEARRQRAQLVLLEKDLARLEALVRVDLARNSRNADAYYELGAIYCRHGHPDRGLALYQKALRINPRHTASRQALARYLNERRQRGPGPHNEATLARKIEP